MCKTFEEWMTEEFSHNELADMVNHGVSGGFSGLIYYSETTELYQKYKEDIWDMLYDDAESYGETILGFIAQFLGAKNVGGADQFENLLVWYAAEKVAYELTKGRYCDEDSEDAENDEDSTDIDLPSLI